MTQTRLGQVLAFSLYHLQSARYMACCCYRTEREYINNKDDGVPYPSHRAYVTSCVFLAVAFLESRINELIIGVKSNLNNPWNEGAISNEQLVALGNIDVGQIRDTKFPKTLEKYQFVLSQLDKPQFCRNWKIYQNVHLLIKLRNDLIHFQPENVYVVPQAVKEEHKLLRTFKNKFPENPIARALNDLQYPDIVLGYGCARWAVTSSIEFVQEFNHRINLDQNYDAYMEMPEYFRK